jgi:hypothetical protein
MKIKLVAAIAAIAVISVLLFAATASAFMIRPSSANSASSGTFRWGPFEFGEGGDDDFREGGMMNVWGGQNGNGSTSFFDDGWGWHG